MATTRRPVIAVTTLQPGRLSMPDSFPDMGKSCFILDLSEAALAPTQSLIQ
jgi:hypothetical protein